MTIRLPCVLMVSDVYFPRVNGVSTSIRTFRADLARAGWNSVLVAPRYPGAGGAAEGDDLVRVPSRYLPFDPEDRLMRARAALAACGRFAGRFDAVHIQTPFVAHRVGLAAARRAGCGTVETYHTLFEQYFHHYLRFAPRAVLQRAARLLSRRQCNAVDRVVAPSAEMATVLRGYGVETPIEVIPTGLDLAEFEGGDGARFRAEHGIGAARPVMLHVGRVAFEKNIGFIVEVLERVRLEIADVLLVIAGEGPALPGLRREIEARGLAGHVLFVGYLDRRRALLDCYRSANVLVFASRTETQGLVPLEAMGVGTPVVSTAVLGTRAIVEPERGAIAAAEEVGAFARAVMRVLADRALQASMGRTARVYVAEQWSSRAMAERLARVYEALAASARPPARASGSSPAARRGRERVNASR